MLRIYVGSFGRGESPDAATARLVNVIAAHDRTLDPIPMHRMESVVAPEIYPGDPVFQ
jgi:hypothetical protein